LTLKAHSWLPYERLTAHTIDRINLKQWLPVKHEMGQRVVIGRDERDTDHTADQEEEMASVSETEVGDDGSKQDNVQSTKRESKIEMRHAYFLSEWGRGIPRRGKNRLPHRPQNTS
jgi:hypothetical protein